MATPADKTELFAIDLKRPGLYTNRELSQLEFNRRVLAQAMDEDTPLLERLRFLCIASANIDEFFEIRVAGLNQQVAFGSVQTGADNLGPSDVLRLISDAAHQLVDEQYRILNQVLIPALDRENIRFLRRSEWEPKLAGWVRDYFNDEVLPLLSPIGLDPAHPFPRVINKNLIFIVSLEGTDAFGRQSGLAVVQAPRALPRLISPPPECISGPHDFIFLSSIIHAHVDDLFPGMRVTGCYQFRVTRNSDLFVDNEEVDNLLRALEGELPARRFRDAVRLEVADNCPPSISDFLLRHFNLKQDALYQVNGPVNLSRLLELHEMVNRPELKYAGFTPNLPGGSAKNRDIFETIRRGDILLLHPFQSFAPVVEFVRKAAADPNVLAIKQTLYRTGDDSVITEALCDAARSGKEVTVVIELRARFDEAANIEVANDLEEAGAHVVYGVVGYKTHAKMILVVRREAKKLRRYVHLGTGNYHARTARLYTDYGLLTCEKAIGEDVNKLFHQLTGLGRAGKLKKLLQSPFTLHKGMLQYIEQEVRNAERGLPAHIIAKMNSLVEPAVIQALYQASQAGVRIDLIVRGICCLRPGIPGVSENIQVRSIVGRFLEHTRVFCFHNGGDPVVFCSSADWMQRNFFSRVETCFPIEDKGCRDEVIEYGLMSYLSDNTQAWIMQSDGSYERSKPKNEKQHSAQTELLQHYCK